MKRFRSRKVCGTRLLSLFPPSQKQTCVYFEDELRRRSSAELLTRDEARRIAVNIAKLLGEPLLLLSQNRRSSQKKAPDYEVRGRPIGSEELVAVLLVLR